MFAIHVVFVVRQMRFADLWIKYDNQDRNEKIGKTLFMNYEKSLDEIKS